MNGGKDREALEAFERADRFWTGFDGGGNRWAGEAAFWLARCYERLGRAAEARSTRDRAITLLSRSPLPIDGKWVRSARDAVN